MTATRRELAAADVDGTVEAVTANGGTEVQAPFGIPGVGRVGVAHDPNGGSFSLMQPVG